MFYKRQNLTFLKTYNNIPLLFMFTKEGLTGVYGYPFSKEAMDVLNFAGEEARGFVHNYISTEHVLLGLIRNGVPQSLEQLEIDLTRSRAALESIIGKGENRWEGDIGLTPRSKKVMELSVDWARRLGDPCLVADHIWLGLVKEGEGIGAGILDSFGVLDQIGPRILRSLRLGTTAASIAQEGLETLARLCVFFDDPSQDLIRKQQVKMILDGALGLISPRAKQQ